MFTADAARIIGITPRQLRSFIRSQGTYAGSGSRYEFSHEEVVELSSSYWMQQPPQMQPQWSRNKNDEFVGTAGLPTQWLRDQTHEAEFIAERQSRLERMSKRLREAGLSVPQMSERDLTINMRALASAMLKGEFA